MLNHSQWEDFFFSFFLRPLDLIRFEVLDVCPHLVYFILVYFVKAYKLLDNSHKRDLPIPNGGSLHSDQLFFLSAAQVSSIVEDKPYGNIKNFDRTWWKQISHRVTTKLPRQNSRIIQGYFKDLSMIFKDVKIRQKHQDSMVRYYNMPPKTKITKEYSHM